jgi:sterol desaturase/sphingolipid hydroxylase (fatty acid hydroxylase superfamily)
MAINYYVAMISDLIAALAFLGFGIHRLSGSMSAAGAVVLLGFLSFGFLEYSMHRWVLHGLRSAARRGHGQHHARPAALIAMPAFVAVGVAFGIWELLSLVCPSASAALFVFGLYAGYNYFALFHHWMHHRRSASGRDSYWRRLDRSHHVHHQCPNVNFGVSTRIWDRIFGTFQPVDEQSAAAASRQRVPYTEALHIAGERS